MGQIVSYWQNDRYVELPTTSQLYKDRVDAIRKINENADDEHADGTRTDDEDADGKHAYGEHADADGKHKIQLKIPLHSNEKHCCYCHRNT